MIVFLADFLAFLVKSFSDLRLNFFLLRVTALIFAVLRAMIDFCIRCCAVKDSVTSSLYFFI